MDPATTATRHRREIPRSRRTWRPARASIQRGATPPAISRPCFSTRGRRRFRRLPLQCAANVASDTFHRADSSERIEKKARRESEPTPLRRRRVRLVQLSSCKYPALVVECLELQRVAARIANKEGCLFARLTRKASVGCNRKIDFASF